MNSRAMRLCVAAAISVASGCVVTPLDQGAMSLPNSNKVLSFGGYLTEGSSYVHVYRARNANVTPASDGWDDIVSTTSAASSNVSYAGYNFYPWSGTGRIRRNGWFPHSGPEGNYKAIVMAKAPSSPFGNDALVTFDTFPASCSDSTPNIMDFQACMSDDSPLLIFYTDVLAPFDCGENGEPPCEDQWCESYLSYDPDLDLCLGAVPG